MRVALDSSASRFDPGGTGRYIEAILARRDRLPGVDLVEVEMGAAWPWTRGLPRQARILVHDLWWVPHGAGSAARAAGADVLHGPAFRVPARAPLPTVVTIHDDTPWDAPPTASWWTRTSLRRSLRQSAPSLGLALVTSEQVAASVLAVLPGLAGRLRVTPLGIDHDIFQPRDAREVGERLGNLGVAPGYVLMVGPHGSRKNYPRMVEALLRAGAPAAGLSLVVAGRAPAADSAAGMPVRQLGRVSDEDLAALYSAAHFTFFASLKEGFGFPVLEAMACACPVLTSRGTVLEALAGDAAVLADPTDVTSLADAARALIEDAGLRDRLGRAGPARAAPYTWDATLATTAAAWQELVG